MSVKVAGGPPWLRLTGRRWEKKISFGSYRILNGFQMTADFGLL
jgi:hypothetical protein